MPLKVIRFGCTNRNVKLRKLRSRRIKRGYRPRDVSRSIFTFLVHGEENLSERWYSFEKGIEFYRTKDAARNHRLCLGGRGRCERFDSRTFFISPSTQAIPYPSFFTRRKRRHRERYKPMQTFSFTIYFFFLSFLFHIDTRETRLDCGLELLWLNNL